MNNTTINTNTVATNNSTSILETVRCGGLLENVEYQVRRVMHMKFVGSSKGFITDSSEFSQLRAGARKYYHSKWEGSGLVELVEVTWDWHVNVCIKGRWYPEAFGRHCPSQKEAEKEVAQAIAFFQEGVALEQRIHAEVGADVEVRVKYEVPFHWEECMEYTKPQKVVEIEIVRESYGDLRGGRWNGPKLYLFGKEYRTHAQIVARVKKEFLELRGQFVC